MIVVYVYADNANEMNCSKHNCLRPAEALNRSGKHQAKILHVSDFSSNKPEIVNFCMDADIIIFERNFFGDAIPAIEFWRVRNKPILAIFDDAYHIITEDNPAHKFWKENRMPAEKDSITTRMKHAFNSLRTSDELWDNVDMAERVDLIEDITRQLSEKIPVVTYERNLAVPALTQFKWGLERVRGIQTPSKVLCKDWDYINDTYYIPNRIEANKYIHAQPLREKKDGEIVIGWHGSLSHVASFKESGIAEALAIVAKKHDNVRVYLGGDEKNFNLVDLPKEKKYFHGYVPDQQFPSLLKTIDIAVAPLATDYDRRRSWVRVIEYMALQIPWAASNLEPYKDVAKYGVMVNNSVDNWIMALDNMVENYGDYKERAQGAPYEFAISQDYDLHVDELIDVYEKCINKSY